MNEADVLAWGAAANLPAFYANAPNPPGSPAVFGDWSSVNPYIIVTTDDGAFWYWNADEPAGYDGTGWHPAPILAADFCAWKNGATACPITDGDVEAFAKAQGYNVYYFPDPLGNKPPKPAYASDATARAFSVQACAFVRWDGVSWVHDDATMAEFVTWRALTIFNG